ncbi:NAD(+)/NADH kinase [Anaeromyxobacter diazotrophicus]|uniref:NAD kinase n=1 Tax=Anaeromyxobacter diazotrophicus TaxID=2590199 RepID=A0A7I9VG49_9BACT|nr:NAD(+)/NADH kinase [Anaeromyxobacter diazotrophicus]GEJ55374.1 NAD kinase [Anaeromyxobacter diazotrophicus]
MPPTTCPVPRSVGIVHKQSSRAAAACAAEAAAAIAARGLTVLVDEQEAARRADLVLVLGGDGTLIHAARILAGRPAPILGVNMGSLGFLTEVPQAELYQALDHVLSGQAVLSERMKLRVHVHRQAPGGGELKLLDTEVLNDAVMAKGTLSRMAEFEVTCSDDLVTTYKADGIIVATPTGSTAYSLAANGPILFPTMRGVILTPICPHMLTQRPIVLPDDRTLNIRLAPESEVYLTLDGQTGLQLQPGDRVQIKQSQNRVLLVQSPRIDYFGILRTKLRWGER